MSQIRNRIKGSGKYHRHVVFYSGGIASFIAAWRVQKKVGSKPLRLMFTDTRMEDEDSYRFMLEGAAFLSGVELSQRCRKKLEEIPPVWEEDERKNVLSQLQEYANKDIPCLVWLADGRNVFDVYRDENYIGDSRFDPCSRSLKRLVGRRWIEKTFPHPQSATLYMGMAWDEEHRLTRVQRFWHPRPMKGPLMEEPLLDKEHMLFQCRQHAGIEPPRMYKEEFPHGNCSGFCCRAGQAHFRLTLQKRPDHYAYFERKEQELLDEIGRDKSRTILKRTVNGQKESLSLRKLRQLDESEVDQFSWGGCGCMADVTDEELAEVEGQSCTVGETDESADSS